MSKFSNKWIKPLFRFIKSDRNGIIVLSILILIAFIVNIVIDKIPSKDKTDFSEFEKALEEWESAGKGNQLKEQFLFVFNPNTISEEELDSLNLPGNIKRNLLNYRKAGGKIRSVVDFRKIYGMNDSIFAEIQKYISIPEKTSVVSKNVVFSKKKSQVAEIDSIQINLEKDSRERNPPLLVELNTADSAQLVQLNGIGHVFATRIIKYRNLLGGFYRKEQLQEVYNFPVETYNAISENVEVDTTVIKKVRINFVDYAELLHHPYLNKRQVQSIIYYRSKNGALNSVDELTQISEIDSLTFNKIKPYLSTR